MTRYLRRVVLAGDGRRFVRVLLSADRGSAIRVLLDGPRVALALRRHGLRPLLPSFPDAPAGPLADVRRVSAAVDAGLAVLPASFTCLRRSAVLLREVRRRGLGGSLHIGVRHGPAGIEAHAWVQVGRHVVNENEGVVASYVPLPLEQAESMELTFE